MIGQQQADALAVIEKQARRNRCPLHIANENFSAIRENGRLVFQNETSLLDLALPRLSGEHQIANAALAIEAAQVFCTNQGIELRTSAIDEGVQSAQWPGRLQHLTHGDLIDTMPATCDIWLDGGHNPEQVQGFSEPC